MMISADNAHGIHPNYADRHDDNHGPKLNGGPVIKINANQRYASNSETSALFRHIAEELEVPVQSFVVRTDMACGSTIGPITASGIGVKTLDIGVPQFAMHSIREMAEACRDRGYEYLSITDHSQSVTVANGLDPARVRHQWDEVEEVRNGLEGVRLFRSLEVDILKDGTLDMPEEILTGLQALGLQDWLEHFAGRSRVGRRFEDDQLPLANLLGQLVEGSDDVGDIGILGLAQRSRNADQDHVELAAAPVVVLGPEHPLPHEDRHVLARNILDV